MQQLGRPREFDPEEVLSKIMQLFWEHGYEATGLSDIIAETGMGKASLYSAFGNKQEMYLKALVRYEALIVDSAAAILQSDDRLPLERIEAFLSAPITAVHANADRRGCFLCNASADRAALDSETSARVQKGYGKLQAAILYALQDADADLETEVVAQRAQLILTVYSGLRVMARSGLKVEDLELAKCAALAAVS